MKGHNKIRNCNGRSNPKFQHITTGGARFTRCPKSWQIFEAVKETHWLNDWGFLEHHKILPSGGGLLDQSSKFIEACTIINASRAAAERANNGES